MGMLHVLRFTPVETQLGSIGVVASRESLREIILPKPSSVILYRTVMQKYGISQVTDISFFRDLPRRLISYFEGYRVEFPDKLDFAIASDFQKSIWETTRTIPYGETRSYGWVADAAGHNRAARAAGTVLGKNPFPIIVPCHRVIAGDGTIGGFSSGTGIKKYLLQLEDSRVSANHKSTM
jgi:methylated-DNA-[protein]-cysteine S-methyltransferase